MSPSPPRPAEASPSATTPDSCGATSYTWAGTCVRAQPFRRLLQSAQVRQHRHQAACTRSVRMTETSCTRAATHTESVAGAAARPAQASQAESMRTSSSLFVSRSSAALISRGFTL